VTLVVDPAPGFYTISASATTSAFDAFAPNNSEAVQLGVRGVGKEDETILRDLTLSQPYPNPSSGLVNLRWGLPNAARIDVRVYDMLGREIATLAEGSVESGWHDFQWKAEVASGVYIVRLTAGTQTRTRRVLVVR
jgi:hypothetical protein